ncbi:MAG: peptidylprolyl isomerase [Chlorobium sp.]
MKKVLRSTLLLLIAGLAYLQGSAFAEVADRVVAVVGSEVIFKSEIDNRALMARLQYPELAKDKGLFRSILDGVIDQKIILAKAKIDSVAIDLNSLDSMVNDRYKQITSSFTSKVEMESRLGKSSSSIRESIREELRNQQLIDTLRKKKTAGITVTYAEAMAFYNTNRGQLTEIPEEVSVSQIIKYQGVPAESRAQSLATIQEIRKELLAGADFATLAMQYSQDPGSAKSGGDLGFVRKGQLIQSFESAAFALKEGGVSDIVETRYGFHLIQLLSKEDNAVHVRHILIGLDRSKGDFSGAIQQLRSVHADLLSGKETFAEMAKKYSDDSASAPIGGMILMSGLSKKTFPPSRLFPQLQQIIASLKKSGDISAPQQINPPQREPFYGILRLNERIAAHPLDPEKDYAVLEEAALDDKSRQIFNQWVQQLRKEVYVRLSDI